MGIGDMRPNASMARDAGASLSNDKCVRIVSRHSSLMNVLGLVSFLTAMSTAMIYGLLPIFLVRILGATVASVGLIEGIAEGGMSLARIASGMVSDGSGAANLLSCSVMPSLRSTKRSFHSRPPQGWFSWEEPSTALAKACAIAPRDAFMTDVTPAQVRGAGFGLRLTFYTTGYVIGPLAAIGLMAASGDNFRLVFWLAVIPAALAILVLLFCVKERRTSPFAARPLRLRRTDFMEFIGAFWWAIAIASLLSLARFSHAFLILKAHSVGMDAAYAPVMIILMHLVYAAAAYPFGVLADKIDRRVQLIFGAGALILLLMSATVARWQWQGLRYGDCKWR